MNITRIMELAKAMEAGENARRELATMLLRADDQHPAVTGGTVADRLAGVMGEGEYKAESLATMIGAPVGTIRVSLSKDGRFKRVRRGVYKVR